MFSLVAVLLDIKLTFMQGGAGHILSAPSPELESSVTALSLQFYFDIRFSILIFFY